MLGAAALLPAGQLLAPGAASAGLSSYDVTGQGIEEVCLQTTKHGIQHSVE